jgi:hypothetical protein
MLPTPRLSANASTICFERRLMKGYNRKDQKDINASFYVQIRKLLWVVKLRSKAS